ncbi:MAG: hypothetical protein ACLU9S_10080 [Oscillospiraceae bacterium]
MGRATWAGCCCDMDYSDPPRTSRPLFFRAVLQDGVLDLPLGRRGGRGR